MHTSSSLSHKNKPSSSLQRQSRDAVAIFSLALGIGANSAVFSLFNQTLLRPLPVRSPLELVNLGAPGPKPGSQSCGQAGDCELVFSYLTFRDLEKVQTVFTGIAAHNDIGVNLASQGRTVSGVGTLVSGSYFPTLGLPPALGGSSRRTTTARRARTSSSC